jgi:hypothetical protein
VVLLSFPKPAINFSFGCICISLVNDILKAKLPSMTFLSYELSPLHSSSIHVKEDYFTFFSISSNTYSSFSVSQITFQMSQIISLFENNLNQFDSVLLLNQTIPIPTCGSLNWAHISNFIVNILHY